MIRTDDVLLILMGFALGIFWAYREDEKRNAWIEEGRERERSRPHISLLPRTEAVKP